MDVSVLTCHVERSLLFTIISYLIVQILFNSLPDVGLERADGFQGTIIINDPNDVDEIALKALYQAEEVIFLQDWYHRDGVTRRTG